FSDPKKNLTLESNASEHGLGSVLLQDGKPITFASQSLSETKMRFAQIRDEMLPAVYRLEKFYHYVCCGHMEEITDHEPLVTTWKKLLSKAPKRLQNLFLRAKSYSPEIIHKPSKEISAADMLSRGPTLKLTRKEVVHSIATYPICGKLMECIQDVTATLREMILKGWLKNKNEIIPGLRPYHSYQEELTVSDGVILRSYHVISPNSLRREMKKRVHMGHLGINSCLQLPRMSCTGQGCLQRSATMSKHEETAIYHDKQPKESKRPWQRVAIDIFS
ncbi:hypothetical protein Z043_113188, partial [Scleropages formosus]